MTGDLHHSKRNRDNDEEIYEPPQLRRFRQLVSLSMIIMMVGILGIAIALIFRLSQPLGPLNSNLSEGRFIIPDGSSVMSVSRFGSSFYLLIEDKTTGMRYIEERSIDDHTILARFRLVPE